LLLLLAALVTSSAEALSCAGDSIALFPPNGDIPPNAVFVIQGFGSASESLRGLTADRLELRTPGTREIVRFTGALTENGVTQIEFSSPRPALRPGQLELWMSRPGRGDELLWSHLGSWNVVGLPDATWPVLVEQPDRITVRTTDSTWGASTFASFSASSDDSSAYWQVSIEPVSDPSGVSRSLLMPGNSFWLGLGPCGGNYTFEPGEEYSVTLVPIDAAGHRASAAPSIPVDFPKEPEKVP
jgi:hypothetical protein